RPRPCQLGGHAVGAMLLVELGEALAEAAPAGGLDEIGGVQEHLARVRGDLRCIGRKQARVQRCGGEQLVTLPCASGTELPALLVQLALALLPEQVAAPARR